MLDQVKEQLARDGFARLESHMSAEYLEALRKRTSEILTEEGAKAGAEFKQEDGAVRLANLVDKGEVFEQMIADPVVLECIESCLGPEFKLGSLNYRAANPNEGGLQPLHVDMGLLMDDSGFRVCNTIWLLDDFTPENGATRAVPGSHLWKQRPQQVLEDTNAPHPQQVLVTGKAGDVFLMNSHTWHGGTTNHTDQPRRALHCLYVRRDVPQQQYQKKLLREDTQARMTGDLRRILALDDELNDELCASGVQLSGFMK
jgi:hypothetical protein